MQSLKVYTNTGDQLVNIENEGGRLLCTAVV